MTHVPTKKKKFQQFNACEKTLMLSRIRPLLQMRSQIVRFAIWFVNVGLKPCVLWPHRLVWSRTPDFHSDNRGSNPLGVINFFFRLESLAQRLEHLTFNEGVDGSNPSRLKSFLNTLSYSDLR